MERVYRVVHTPGADHAIATTHGFVAAADTLARALSVDAAQWAASTSWRPHQAHLRREVLHVSAEQFAEFAARVEKTFDEASASESPGRTFAINVTLAAIPASHPTSQDHGED